MHTCFSFSGLIFKCQHVQTSVCKSLLNIYSMTSPKYLVIFMFIKLLLSSRLERIGQNGSQLVGCLDVTFDCCDWLFYVEVYVYIGS